MSMPFPAIRRPSEVSWRLRALTQVHQSPLDGSTQTLRQPGEVWVGTIAWPSLGEEDRRALQAFLARLGGRAGRFWYGPPDAPRRATGTGRPRSNRLSNGEWAGAGIGVLPAPWALTTNIGVGVAVTAVGSDANGQWIELTASGTPTGNNVVFALRTSAGDTQPSAIGEPWTAAASLQTLGAVTNIGAIRVQVQDANAAGAYQAGFSNSVASVAPLASVTRREVTRTLADLRAAFAIEARASTIGSPVALALRIWRPQLEPGATATAYIATSTGPVTVIEAPLVNGAGQAGALLATRNWAPNAQAMRVGDFFSFEDTTGRRRLHQATADVTADAAGLASIPIAPPLRRAGADGAALEILAPTGVFRLAEDEVGVSTRPPLFGACTLDIVEALA